MQFLCAVRGQQYAIQADMVGGYTLVYFSPADKPEIIITYQLFPVVLDETDAHDSAVFLERVGRIAIAHFEHADEPFPLITMIGYTSTQQAYAGELQVTQNSGVIG